MSAVGSQAVSKAINKNGNVIPDEERSWYVMRVTYGRELKLREVLMNRGIECYVPTTTRDNRTVSAMANIIFVHTTRDIIRITKEAMETSIPMRFYMDKAAGLPMTVPEKEMQDFIRVTGNCKYDIDYLDNPEIVYTKGRKVEITYGPFCGVTGYVLRIKRDRKVVITVSGLISAIISADMKPEWLKLI